MVIDKKGKVYESDGGYSNKIECIESSLEFLRERLRNEETSR
jgi:hypothetical protein